ncbi:hypothetical protein [uncultured Mediterranean phage uvMED]|nr:hypothetical protein [uncultured Mediterranean phage uvMED]
MAYAINRNGTIQVYTSVPKAFEGSQKEYVGGFDQLTRAKQKAEGLFDVVMPDGYNSQIHDLGEIFWDSANAQFTYPKTNKTWTQSLAELKTQKIANLKAFANSKLSETDWVIIRDTELGNTTDSTITDARAAIRTTVETKEGEINAKTTKAQVVQYDINL